MRGAREAPAPRDSLNFRRTSLLSRNEFESGTFTIVLHATLYFTYVSVIYRANFPFKAHVNVVVLLFFAELSFVDVLATVQEVAFIQIPGVVSGKAVCCLANKEIVDDRPSVVRGATQSVVVSGSLCELRCPTSFREGDL